MCVCVCVFFGGGGGKLLILDIYDKIAVVSLILSFSLLQIKNSRRR